MAPAPSLVGTVDAGGGVLPGVVVTVMPQGGGEARAVISGINGRYAFEDLAEGTYRIDSYLPGFDVMRRNLVVVRRGETAQVDVTLPPSPYCECIDIWARLGISRQRLSARMGQVMDDSGRPLPRAQLEIVGPVGREVAYANREGQFQVRLSPNQTWPLTARDSGFGAVTLTVTGGDTSPLVFRLPNADTGALPAVERLAPPCCQGNLFTNLGP